MPSQYDLLAAAIRAEQPVVACTIIAGSAHALGARMLVYGDGTRNGTLGADQLDTRVVQDALAALAAECTQTRDYQADAGENLGVDVPGEPLRVFLEVYLPPPTLLIVGAVHIGIALTSYARMLGFRCVVIDARGTFATPERFPHADQLIHAWPDEAMPPYLTPRTYVAVLTHDPKLDDPAITLALAASVRYVGALGSARTHAKRLARLRSAGVPEAQLARLHAPIGLKIGAQTPEEIAVSIIAEIVQARRRG